MSYSLYGTWTIEDTKDIGRTFKAVCKANYGYENHLTEGKVYEICVAPRILPVTPLGDNGREIGCHLERFDKEEA